MANNLIPEVFKLKIDQISGIFKGLFFLFLALFVFFAIFTFDINDNSFLTKSSKSYSNIIGPIGSYTASFLIYSFGGLSYLLVIFFSTASYFSFTKKNFNYFFIRLLFILISFVLIPQIFFFLKFEIKFIEQLNIWGEIANKIYSAHDNEWASYIFSLIGIVIFFRTQNLLSLLKIPKLKFNNIKKISKSNEVNIKLKKDPIINQMHQNNYQSDDQELNENDFGIKKDINENFTSPSLDILDNSSSSYTKRNNQSNIKERSEQLENVFADFNIQIKVINVKLGPVVTLYEILPSAGIKINTIINLAGDISRSMGVGAVRIAQIYGTQYLGVEVPNEQRESVTIKELLSDPNFKNSPHKIQFVLAKIYLGILK